MSMFLSSSMGKKLIIASSGVLFCFFLVFHLANNLLLFAGPDVFNSFVSGLEKIKPLVRILEIVLLFILCAHVVNAFFVTREGKKTKGKSGSPPKGGERSSFYSRTMGVSGSFVFVFIVIHLSTFWYRFQVKENHYSYYDTVMSPSVGFGNLFVTLIYLIAMVFLGFHLRHGFQSAIQTFGIKHTKVGRFVVSLSILFWLLIPLGFFSIAFWFGILGGSVK